MLVAIPSVLDFNLFPIDSRNDTKDSDSDSDLHLNVTMVIFTIEGDSGMKVEEEEGIESSSD